MGGHHASHHNKTVEVRYPKAKTKLDAYFWEKRLLSYSRLKMDEEITVVDVPINYMGPNYIHTIICKEQSGVEKPNLVLIHGFCGTASNFYKTFKHLLPKFNIYCPDIIGMGFSSRPQVKFKHGIDYVNFFIDYVELWRQALGLGKIYLVGHSLGGYFAGHYAAKFPQNILRLSLWSPAGITDVSRGGKITENMDPATKKRTKMIRFFWSLKITLRGLYRNRFTKFAVKGQMRNGFQIPRNELKCFAKVFFKIMRYPKDLNKAMYKMFRPPMPTSRNPVEPMLLRTPKTFKVDIYFGAKDYMDTTGAKRLVQSDPKRFKMIMISKVGHQFPIENSGELCTHVIRNFEEDL